MRNTDPAAEQWIREALARRPQPTVTQLDTIRREFRRAAHTATAPKRNAA